MELNKMDLIHAYKAMLMVAKQYNLEIEFKYQVLEEALLEDYDLDVVDMMGSLEHIYRELMIRY